jgi:CrcB protein
MRSMERFLAICAAGAVGTGLRYLLSSWFARHSTPGFPWGTLVVNATGCFLLAAVVQAGAAHLIPAPYRPVIAMGLLGGFTTYSSFNQDTLAHAGEGNWLVAGANLGGTVVVCLLFGVLGTAAGRLIVAALASPAV